MKTMTFAVEGMMCGHCEARVTDALAKLGGISESKASAQANQVICTYDELLLSKESIIEVIEAIGYEVK